MPKIIRKLNQLDDLFRNARRCVLHSGICEPPVIGKYLRDRTDTHGGLTVETFLPAKPCEYLKIPGIRIETAMPGPHLREAVNRGEATLIRESLFEQSRAFRSGRRKVDLLVLQVTPPDGEGIVSLGPNVGTMPDLLTKNPIVLGIMNPRLPRSSFSLSVDLLDAIFEAENDLPVIEPEPVDAVDTRIAENLLKLLRDDIAIEVGIGSTPDAIIKSLAVLRGLRIHTGLLTDPIMALVESGAVDGAVTATMAQGSSQLYRWMNDCELVSMRPVSHTHSPRQIGQIPDFHAINGALQIDLAGNVNAERIADRIISCPGGLPDFAEGARRSQGGRSIIVLRSTAGRTGKSTIVDRLDYKTLDHRNVDVIVTEFGIADLSGLDAMQRADAIASIAHPCFHSARK